MFAVDEIYKANLIGSLSVLSGTKYGLKQTRGKFGLGAKMVCFYLLVSSYDISKIRSVYPVVQQCL